jgi:hypothetical protein
MFGRSTSLCVLFLLACATPVRTPSADSVERCAAVRKPGSENAPLPLVCKEALRREMLGFRRDSLDISRSDLARRSAVEGREKWKVDGQNSPYLSYNSTFFRALAGSTFEQHAATRKNRRKTTHVADFFGSAVFTETPGAFDSLTGVRFQELDPQFYPEGYPAPHWRELTGDIYAGPVWVELDKSMATRAIAAFDIIIFRPDGPLQMPSINYVQLGSPSRQMAFFSIHHRVLDRAWQRLSTDEGEMFIQLTPEIFEARILKDWVELLRARGVQCASYGNEAVPDARVSQTLYIKRTAQSPARLPALELMLID